MLASDPYSLIDLGWGPMILVW